MYPYVTTGSYSASDGTTAIADTDYRNYVTSGSRTFSELCGYIDTSVFTRVDKVVLRQSLKRTYATPFVYDVLRESAGSFGEPVAYTQTIDNHYETSLGHSNVLSESKAVAADGSNGAGGMSYDVPFSRVLASNGTGTSSAGPAQGGVAWSFGVPQAAASGHVIPATETYAGKMATNLVPDWYPGHNAAAKPLVTHVIQDLGHVKAPGGCGKRAGVTATDLRLTYTGLDPVYGDTYDETIDYFAVPGIGRVCRLDHIVETIYDNKVKGSKTSITTTDSADILVSEQIH